jgi:hypothetical protein
MPMKLLRLWLLGVHRGMPAPNRTCGIQVSAGMRYRRAGFHGWLLRGWHELQQRRDAVTSIDWLCAPNADECSVLWAPSVRAEPPQPHPHSTCWLVFVRDLSRQCTGKPPLRSFAVSWSCRCHTDTAQRSQTDMSFAFAFAFAASPSSTTGYGSGACLPPRPSPGLEMV